MKKTLATVAFVLVLVIGAAAEGTDVRIGETAVLAKTVPLWVAKAQRLGPAEDARRVVLTAYLHWQRQDELEQLFRDQVDPRSARYQQFLTPAQFHAALSPKAEDVAAVEQALKGLGFQIADNSIRIVGFEASR